MKYGLLLILTFSLVACNQANENKLVDDSRTLVTVNNKAISEQAVQVFLRNQGIEQPSEEQLNQAVKQLTEQQLWLDYAQKQSIGIDMQQQIALQQLRDQLLVQQAISHYMDSQSLTEADLQAEYKRVTEEIKDQLFHVHHLLYRDEVEALQMLDKINAGITFAEAESEYLQAHSDLQNVGDIGWVNLKQVPESFSAPLQTLEPQGVYDEPVMSQFGVHVLYLEAKKQAAPPTFAEAKAGIKRSLQQKQLERFKQLLEAKATIKSAP